MAYWPTTLPPPVFNGYQLAQIDPAIRTTMEGGNVRARRRTTARTDRITCVVVLTDSEFYTFRAWFDDAGGANGGASWFDVSLQVGGINSSALQTVEATFAAVWSASHPLYNQWEVTMPLEVRYA